MDDDEVGGPAPPAAAEPAAPTPAPAHSQGATATALYDYEAGEDNELAFPENATIKNVVCSDLVLSATESRLTQRYFKTFPDEDWWHGEYNGHAGLFPANYTKLND